jgi:hypothetical protein
MYKDKERQREAVREATRRWRVSQGITEKVSRVSPKEEGITVIPVIKTKADAVKAVSRLDSRGRLAFCMKHRCYKQTCKCE